MVNFSLLTNEQTLVDKLESFKLNFSVFSNIEECLELEANSILLVDLTDQSIDLAEVLEQCPSKIYIVILVENLARKEIKKILEEQVMVFAHISMPLIKADLLALLEDLSTYISGRLTGKTPEGETRSSHKFDLEFSLFEDETMKDNGSANEETPESAVEQMDPNELKKLSKKLGNFNFFEDAEFNLNLEENVKIQQKFNTIFGLPEERSKDIFAVKVSKEKKAGDMLDLDSFLDESNELLEEEEEDMSSKNKKGLEFNMPKLEFEEASRTDISKPSNTQNDKLDFDLEFNQDETKATEVAAAKNTDALTPAIKESSGENLADEGFSLGDELEMAASELTSKTIVMPALKKEAKASGADDDHEAKTKATVVLNNVKDELNFSSASEDTKASEVPSTGLDFNSLDSSEEFSLETNNEAPAATASSSASNSAGPGLDLALDGADDFVLERTSSKVKKEPEAASSLALKEDEDDLNFSVDLPKAIKEEKPSASSMGSMGTGDYMSSAEARANIESTINDIIRPDLSELTKNTADFSTSEFSPEADDDLDEKTLVANPGLLKDLNHKSTSSPSQGGDDFKFDENFEFDQGVVAASSNAVDEISFDTGVRAKNIEKAIQETRSNYKVPRDELNALADSHLVFKNVDQIDEEVVIGKVSRQALEAADLMQKERRHHASKDYGPSNYQDEDFVRAQATIRQLREEREELMTELKQLRRENKELEQDNLSLRAQNDELRIEQSILRKRHMAEMEDSKYQLQLADEKRLTAEERLKHSEKHREKLEQKLRLDFSQVRQREKELESQLELLTIDHDTQIQTRDTKILELRRKIESLEFNMENASIREQKTNEDRKKLEDKLIKIMKTLRHSIENIDEDDYRNVLKSDDE